MLIREDSSLIRGTEVSVLLRRFTIDFINSEVWFKIPLTIRHGPGYTQGKTMAKIVLSMAERVLKDRRQYLISFRMTRVSTGVCRKREPANSTMDGPISSETDPSRTRDCELSK